MAQERDAAGRFVSTGGSSSGGGGSFRYRKEVEAELARGAAMAFVLGAYANRAAEAARALAPVDSGEYRQSIGGAVGVERGTLVGRVYSKDFKAHWIEFGTVDTPVFAPLRRGVESLGLKVGGSGRRQRTRL
jgi:hypothetical protein